MSQTINNYEIILDENTNKWNVCKNGKIIEAFASENDAIDFAENN